MKDKKLPQLRRDRIGFIFQAFDLLPTLNAIENITLPMDIAGRKPDAAWLRQVGRPSGSPSASSAAPPGSPAASSTASRRPGARRPAGDHLR
ncbi:hypothetical protein SBADM41S_08102 [Streptomyces badius]